jgi:hypothetical protein
MKRSVGPLLTAILISSSLVAGPVSSAAAAPTSALPKLSLTINASSITATGPVQSGGVNVLITNKGKKEAAAILFQLKPGVTEAEVNSFIKSKKSKDPNAASKYGSIVFDQEAAAGKTAEAQTTLAPGQYLALAAPGEGPPKFKTMFTVTAAQTPAGLPKPQATIRSIEFDFRGPTTLHQGELVGFRNDGYLVHMDFAFPVKSKSAAKQAMSALMAGKEKELKKLVAGAPVSFAGPLSPGAFQQEKITAKPGWYVQVCFMETQEGVPHTRLGMERMIKIAK